MMTDYQADLDGKEGAVNIFLFGTSVIVEL